MRSVLHVSTVGEGRVFLEETWDRRFPLFSEVDVCPLTTVQGRDPGPGIEEMERVAGGPWGVGGAPDGEAGAEAERQGDAFRGEAAGVSLGQSGPEMGRVAGSPGHSSLPLRGRLGG